MTVTSYILLFIIIIFFFNTIYIFVGRGRRVSIYRHYLLHKTVALQKGQTALQRRVSVGYT